ncbi:MAG TPA: anhydro-N-acetylmuramic acid kinase [Gemmataceae bacterium]|nr:anhydro-N-acetylmuramic acid kinase [Gemmataceae bacterium]
MPPRWIIGLASGANADEVDAALLEIDGAGLEMRPRLAGSLHQPYGADLKEMMRRLSALGPCEVREVALLHRLLGESFAAAARTAADQASLSLHEVQVIGCPGHTVWHETEGRFPATLPLGMAAVVAERCGVTTVGDFRSRDVAAGGQGLPLAALTDFLLFRSAHENRVLLHLGGTARVVFLPAAGRPADVIGFEAGPCNLLLDALMRHATGGRAEFDAGGKHAVQGKCIEGLLRTWLDHPYFSQRPPKSLPRHVFGEAFAAAALQQARELQVGMHDLLCTATHFVARAVGSSLQRFLPAGRSADRTLLSGGGARNGLLWRLLEQQSPRAAVGRTDEVGAPVGMRKAMSFGLLAALTVDGVSGNAPSATGAAGPRLLGSLTPGSSANWARCLAWMAVQSPPPLAD